MSMSHEVQWYNRNPKDIIESWIALLQSPHTIERRWIYTVPAGRNAFVELLETYVSRIEASTDIGPPMVYIQYTKAGNEAKYLLYCECLTKEIGGQNGKTIGKSILMLEGDTIQGVTWDAGTDGKCQYLVAAKITEFDAYAVTIPIPVKPDIQAPTEEKPWWKQILGWP